MKFLMALLSLLLSLWQRSASVSDDSNFVITRVICENFDYSIVEFFVDGIRHTGIRYVYGDSVRDAMYSSNHEIIHRVYNSFLEGVFAEYDKAARRWQGQMATAKKRLQNENEKKEMLLDDYALLSRVNRLVESSRWQQ